MGPSEEQSADVRVQPPVESGWEARLELRFERCRARTVLVERNHFGPLCVQKSLYPEDEQFCHSIIVHPPGGIAGGDSLAIEVIAAADTHALLTTPGATRWYRSLGPASRQQVNLAVAKNASLEWLPQENIYFDAAQARSTVRVALQAGAVFIGWEIGCFGRAHSGERFRTGRVRQTFEVVQQGKRLFGDYGEYERGGAVFDSPLGLAGHTVSGTMLAIGKPASDQVLASARASAAQHGENCAVTRLPDVFLARYLGDSAEEARRFFVALWSLFRPAVIGRVASIPRIWGT
ncbi:MAG TPA: urease accessory protein UreD [Burkholderiales bacterium]|nr:urease accessory protein UreD [Burkholderiales bacterium]